ncbi:hypothetical protein ASPWEDRAFT_48082 [Aspergillus wentii DTO 134E9]|uniref:PH domain-containing protein n=1 Tax=Aspergillus wentii DTO 134E9 TaxID=1073089 RepID=A0A1L9S2Y4_ASPWE|nr:uncharacterized protein ASPWEDRAFT_48082 [Aspergillus wentii DTO 134E9]OJJ41525.1 hypothetical protein ASPWEDRAFT_48082 [Aspergillus wentii DTO 134E9]
MSTIEDPFVSNSQDGSVCRESHRYSSFDTQLFSLNASSPAQAKRALEAHLAETERRLEEASKLGTALIEQQRELEDKLKEVERQQDEGEVGPDLRRKLVDLEKEYNEIGRETARAFLGPKRPAGADDGHLGTPSFDQKSPISPALFASQATNSPSKVSVPSRKQRNQPSSRVHDIEFATEISTSLLAQVRQLQALLAEREDALKIVNLEKSRLELEAEGYAQRIRALDESEQRYKDENWALETQTHELMADAREAADREARLNSSLSSVTVEKNSVERELEDLKQVNAKILEDQMAAQKANDSEVHLLRRNLHAGDAEKLALQQKLEELNSQNEELARVVAMRLRQHEADSARDSPQDNDSDERDNSTPENSPPPSPNKFTPRHNHLETETLRSSLGHAHRMIQNLKSTIHREKTEKIELKRMLQDARDEVETRRREANGPGGLGSKRQKTKAEPARKAPRPDLLGAGRKKTEVEVHDTDWEDNTVDGSPSSRSTMAKSPRNVSGGQSSDEPSDAYQTATEADDAFETANERETATESDAFQTGIESMADDSSDTDQLTETEDSIQRTPRQQRVSPLVMAKRGDRNSYHSTASTSADEDESSDGGFPSPSQISGPRQRLKTRRSMMRRIRPSGEAPMASGSRPSSSRNSPATSFTQDAGASEGQSLFAELAELDGTEEEGDYGAVSQVSTPRMLPETDSRRPSEAMLDMPPKPAMVDSGVMTDPWEPTPAVNSMNLGAISASETPEAPEMVSSGTQQTPMKAVDEQVSSVQTPPKMAWDEHSREAGQEETAPAVPEPPQLDISSVSSQETVPVAPKLPELTSSYVVGGITEPVEGPALVSPEMTMSSHYTQHTEPVIATLPEPEPVVLPELAVSSIFSENTQPIVATLPEPEPVIPMVEQGTSTDLQELDVSSIFFEQTEPVVAKMPEPTPVPVVIPEPMAPEPELPELSMSVINAESTEPVSPKLPEPVVIPEPELPELAVSAINTESTEPIIPKLPEVVAPSVPECSFSTIRSVETLPVESLPRAIIPTLQVSDEDESPRELNNVHRKSVSESPAVVVAEDSTSDNDRDLTSDEQADAPLPLGAVSGNAVPRSTKQQSTSTQADQGAQTILSSKQIDQILMDRASTRPLSPPDSDKAKELGASPFATPKARPRPTPQSSTPSSLPSNHKRPGSATSVVSSVYSHPPLPADHREAIIAAEKRSIDHRPASPSVMGPPLAPASAYRVNGPPRPRTPNDQATQAGSARTTSSRAKMRRESQVSRRSSVSSFASEIEERFNMHPSAGPTPQGYAPGTDPRMIQAITQTMIGEFLWKYTRKTVSGDMSSTRHRRYFWVHPYTRTLYWSATDPQSAGKTELRTKSVPIEAVRVVADDNPYPPGLHCRSLEVVSPGRRVRFTATTSQRHETWFNALSYLLLRNSENDEEEQENNITLEDIDEFNPGFRSSSRQNARMSFSSSQSRTLRNLPKQRAGSAMSVRQTATPGRVSPALSAPAQDSSLQIPEQQPRQVSSSRLSTILNTTIKGSFGRKGRHGYAESSLHDGSIHDHGSVDNLSSHSHAHTLDLDNDRLENVRACCDGRHDVSSLSRTSRYSPRVNRIHSHH